MGLPPEQLALLTDLYQLTMAQTYFHEGHNGEATFSLFIRRYPPNRGFFVSCGLEEVLRYLEALRFSSDATDRLRSTGVFSDEFLKYLKGLRFTGEVRAIPEGRLFFANEPVLEVTAPIIEAQIVETFIINQVNLQTLIATKAARCVHAAGGRTLVDFSLRRTQGTDAGMKVARASYIAGFAGTSNVLASLEYGIPPSGTMATPWSAATNTRPMPSEPWRETSLTGQYYSLTLMILRPGRIRPSRWPGRWPPGGSACAAFASTPGTCWRWAAR